MNTKKLSGKLQIAGHVLLMAASLQAQDIMEGSNKPPNILLIISDDLRTELNCYGAHYIKSPNIDELARNGFLFNRAYCQQAVCAASRASFLTGCRPNTTGVDYPYSEYFVNSFWPSHPSIAEYFERQGYNVRTFGKVHHDAKDKLKIPHWQPKTKYYALEENIKLAGPRGRSNLNLPYECADVPDDAYSDGLVTNEALKAIDDFSSKNKPFFIAVGFYKPHLPFCAPKKYWDLYNETVIGLAPNREHPKGSPDYSTASLPLKNYKGFNNLEGNTIPEDIQIKLRHAYAACISYVDAQVGKLTEKLKQNGEINNTIIIFISDHGYHLGHQGTWGKNTNFENSTLSPMIISIPGKQKNIRLNQIVEYVDIYPSLVELAGFIPADYLEGISFVPLLNNPNMEWKKAAFSQFPRGKTFEGYAIRTKDFRYVEWRSYDDNALKSRELYDHRTDSLETINVAENPVYSTIVDELSYLLNKGWKATLPDGVYNFSSNKAAPESVPLEH